jgi:hypothetical protein
MCGEVNDIILLDEFVFENNGRFLEKAQLDPANVPNNFMGCPSKVGAIRIDPCVIMIETFTQNYGSTVFKLAGFSDEILKFV